MALGGGVFLAQNKKLPGTYINFISGASASASASKRGVTAVVPVTMSLDKDGNLHVTYNKGIEISFELDSDANLYVSYDGQYNISFELDDRGNLYMLESD